MMLPRIMIIVVMLVLLAVDDIVVARKKKSSCPSLRLENGMVKLRRRGRIAKFSCNRRYTMFEGDRFVTCIVKKWNGRIPKCIRYGCEDLPTLRNGESQSLYSDALVQYWCWPGYELEGSPALTCDGENWNDTTPTCLAPNPGQSLRKCYFESGDDLCGWTQETADDFDWQRHKGSTPSFSVGTGPPFDHTSSSPEGYYLYIEGSRPREENDKARIFSPVYEPPLDVSSCFTFWYYMYGKTTGQLNVYVKLESMMINFVYPSITLEGDHGEGWKLALVDLHYVDEKFQIILEGIRGRGYMSDIAVDDLSYDSSDECLYKRVLAIQFAKEVEAHQNGGTTTSSTTTTTVSNSTTSMTTSATTVTMTTTSADNNTMSNDIPTTDLPSSYVNSSTPTNESSPTMAVTTLGPTVIAQNDTETSTPTVAPSLPNTVTSTKEAPWPKPTTTLPTYSSTEVGSSDSDNEDKLQSAETSSESKASRGGMPRGAIASLVIIILVILILGASFVVYQRHQAQRRLPADADTRHLAKDESQSESSSCPIPMEEPPFGTPV
ncbi:uncharacterized protein LOC143038883 isoform X3 [Oratosquilla oratoria]|uniref:uncharacterized protein LOC143038883 isoform X3 n=1 Tax=Oratosquilla oratoria TaxID=337810 RepID=UPI003F75BED3